MDSKKTGMRCSVQFCKSKASTRNISFFQYPKDDRLALWTKNCGTENLTEELSKKNSYKVCGDHFVDSMFLNSTTKNRLVFNAIPTIFNDEIMFERTKLAKLQSKTDVDKHFDDNSKDQSSCSSSIPGTEGLRSHFSGSMNTSDASNESCSSITTTDSSNQTPGYLSANTPRKQKLVTEIKSGKQEVKKLKKNIVNTDDVAQLEASTSQNADNNEDSNATPLEIITNSKLPNLKNWTSPSLHRPLKLVTGKRKRIPGSMNKIQHRNQNCVYEEKLNLIQMEKEMMMMQFEWERVEHELRVEALKLDVEIKKKSLNILK